MTTAPKGMGCPLEGPWLHRLRVLVHDGRMCWSVGLFLLSP
jgi:hypothetical protein